MSHHQTAGQNYCTDVANKLFEVLYDHMSAK
jgi:hypothetical protein